MATINATDEAAPKRKIAKPKASPFQFPPFLGGSISVGLEFEVAIVSVILSDSSRVLKWKERADLKVGPYKRKGRPKKAAHRVLCDIPQA